MIYNTDMESKLYIFLPAWIISQMEGAILKNKLEEIRKQRGIKQEELADAMGVSRQTISSLENGRYNPSVILAIKLARYFSMNVEDIFIYEEAADEK